MGIDTMQPLHMWTYWRDKKGTMDALPEYFPELLDGNRHLRYALDKIEMAETMQEYCRVYYHKNTLKWADEEIELGEVLINAIMHKLEREEEDLLYDD